MTSLPRLIAGPLALALTSASALAVPPSSSAPPPTAQQVLLSAKPQRTFAARNFIRGASAISGGRTEYVVQALESNFSWVRVEYCNATTSAQTIDKTYAQATREVYTATSAQIAVHADALTNSGTGFAVNDTLTLGGGTAGTAAQLIVTDVDATGKPLGWIINVAGSYSVPPAGAMTVAATSGSGTGTLTFTVAFKPGPTFVPLDAGGNTLTMQPVYWNAVANAVAASKDPTQIGIDPTSPDVGPGIYTATTAVAVAVPAGTTAHPACVFSDWTYIQSVARQDGGFRPYLEVRSYISGSITIQGKTDASSWTDPAINQGREFVTYDGGGDQTTSTSPAASATLRTAVVGVQAIGEVPVMTVLACGDSLTQGHMGHNSYSGAATFEAYSGYYSWANIATSLLSRASRPVAFFNSGWTAQTTPQIFTRCIEDIQRIRPSVVFIAPYSPNDTQTMAQTQIGFSLAMSLARMATQVGAIPILWTSMPVNGKTTGSQDDPRNWVNAKIRASGYVYADFDSLITDGNYPASILAQYNSGDGLHPNAAGYQIEATRAKGAQATLQAVIGN